MSNTRDPKHFYKVTIRSPHLKASRKGQVISPEHLQQLEELSDLYNSLGQRILKLDNLLRLATDPFDEERRNTLSQQAKEAQDALIETKASMLKLIDTIGFNPFRTQLKRTLAVVITVTEFIDEKLTKEIKGSKRTFMKSLGDNEYFEDYVKVYVENLKKSLKPFGAKTLKDYKLDKCTGKTIVKGVDMKLSSNSCFFSDQDRAIDSVSKLVDPKFRLSFQDSVINKSDQTQQDIEVILASEMSVKFKS